MLLHVVYSLCFEDLSKQYRLTLGSSEYTKGSIRKWFEALPWQVCLDIVGQHSSQHLTQSMLHLALSDRCYMLEWVRLSQEVS